MLRILAVVVWIAITVYALADWLRTPEDQVPARIPKAMWLVLIILTIPSFSLGSIAWIIVRAVARTEAGQAPLPGLPIPGADRPSPDPRPAAPDDDPEFLFRLERDIQRERKRAEERRRHEGDGPSPMSEGGEPGAD